MFIVKNKMIKLLLSKKLQNIYENNCRNFAKTLFFFIKILSIQFYVQIYRNTQQR